VDDDATGVGDLLFTHQVSFSELERLQPGADGLGRLMPDYTEIVTIPDKVFKR
jgi:hypothetical protein